jgi:1-acyl-sn-glycerol-3-phosphate acyltransferase
MIRFAAVLISLTMLTLLLAPFQLIALAFGLRWQQSIPHLFHRIL